MACNKVHLHAQLRHLAFLLVLGLLSRLLEPLASLLLALLLRLSLPLVPGLLRTFPQVRPSQMGWMGQILLQGQKGLLEKRCCQYK